MGLFSKKKDEDKEEEAERKLKLKAFKAFKEEKTPIEVSIEMKLDIEKIELFYTEWLEAQQRMEERKIEAEEKSSELKEKLAAAKRKGRKTKPTDFESPFSIQKAVKDEKTGRKSNIAYYPVKLVDMPHSVLDFIDFAQEYGDGSYEVYDANSKKVKDIAVRGQGFSDPLDKEDEDWDDEYPPNYPPQTYYPGGPPVPPQPPRKKGKPGHPQPPPYPYPYPYGQQYPPFDPNNPQVMAEMYKQDRIENFYMEMIDKYLSMGNVVKAEACAKKLYTIQTGMGAEGGEGDGNKTFKDWVKEMGELSQGIASMAEMLGYNKGEQQSKYQEMASAVSTAVESVGKNVVDPIKDYLGGEKRADQQLDAELTQLQMPQRPQRPALPPARSIETNPVDTELQKLGVIEGEPAKPADNPDLEQMKVPEAKEPEPNPDIVPIEPEPEDQPLLESGQPLTEESDMDPDDKPFSMTSMGLDETYAVHNIIPEYTEAMKTGKDPIKLANHHFYILSETMKGKAVFTKKRKLKILRTAKKGFQFYLDKYQAEIESKQLLYDPVYVLLRDEGEEGLREKWNPPEGMTYKQVIALMKVYGILKEFLTELKTESGKVWMTNYQAQMLYHMQKYLAKEKGIELKPQPPPLPIQAITPVQSAPVVKKDVPTVAVPVPQQPNHTTQPPAPQNRPIEPQFIETLEPPAQEADKIIPPPQVKKNKTKKLRSEEVPCKFKDLGCKRKIKPKGKYMHELKCKYNPVPYKPPEPAPAPDQGGS